MIGCELVDFYLCKDLWFEGVLLICVQGLNVFGWVRDIVFEVVLGEIFGFVGFVGVGCMELFEGLLGLCLVIVDCVEIVGKLVCICSLCEVVDLGFIYFSEDCKGKGLYVNFLLW